MISTVPAVVVGDNLNGLGVVRSLARGGVPTILVGTTRRRAAMWSRHCRTVVVDKLHERSLIDNLLKLRSTLDAKPVLILADEMAVSTVFEHRDELRGSYRFHLPPQDIVAKLTNKARFNEFAEQNDLCVPRTVVMRPDTPFAELSAISFPVVIKSAERQPTNAGGTEQSHYAATLKEAEILCRRMLESTGELIVQECIGGPDNSNCFALFHFGQKPENFMIFAGRKIVSNPATIGNTSLCIAAPEVMGSLEPLIAKFLDLTEFQGFGSLEFKWDPQQRRYVIIGVTVGRTDWQEEIATLSGVNLPLAAYRDEIGLPPLRSGEVIRTVAWRDTWLRGKLSPVLPPSMRVYDGYWRLSDPLPGLIHYTQAALTTIHRQILKPVFESKKTKMLQCAVAEKFRFFVKPIFNKGNISAP
jgi:predicted ATP-grasp superfamily ATP-dependent carboligase